MSRSEMYPWSLLTEVGDYFAVPSYVKPYSYMSALVSQKNYKDKERKLSTVKTTYGTLVLLAQIGEDLPPFEYRTAEGIMAITSRAHVRSQDHNTALGERATRAPRTVDQIVAEMTPEVREENLPWWNDPQTGKLVFNSKVATPEDLEKWYNKQPLPDRYPEYYNLDENLMKREDRGSNEDEDDFFETLEEENEE